MKITAQVSRVLQYTGKPTDLNKLLPITWDVALLTHPHIGDISLGGASPEFSEWAKSLKCNDIIEISFEGK